MRGATSPLVATIVVVLVVTVGVALDQILPAPTPEPTDIAGARTAVSGAWYCVAGRADAENQLEGVATTMPDQATSSALRLDVVADGGITRGGEIEVLPGALQVQPIASTDSDLAIAARWWRTPATVGRLWHRNVTGEPGGRLEGTCEPEAGTRWYLPGVSTAGGAQARIAVANPFDTDAAISIDLYTEAGIETPELLKNLSVPARSVRVVELNDHAPERQDLGALVTARAGRVVAEGWQTVDPAVGGVDGVTLSKLARRPGTSWTVPWLAGGDADTWAWVLNPSDRPAQLEITVHTPEGGSPLSDMADASVPPGTLQRVDLRGVLPEGIVHGAVTIASANDVPIVVSTAAVYRSQDVARTGFATQLGVTEADPGWTIITGGNAGRAEALHLVNPTSSPAIVDVSVSGQVSVHGPEWLQGLTVPAGTGLDLDLRSSLPDLGVHTIHVTAEEGLVVAGVRAFGPQGELDLVAHAGVPTGAWRGAEDVPPVGFSSGLSWKLGTRSGPAVSAEPTPVVPTDAPSPQDTGLPTPTLPPPSPLPTDPTPPRPDATGP